MSDWKTTTVGKVASGFLNGGTPTTKRLEYWEGKIPWTTSKRLDNTLELSSGEKYISDEAVEKSSTNVVPKGNILFTTRVGVGKVAINRIDIAISQDLTGVLIDSKNYDTKFLVYQLGIDSIQQYVSMNKRGATIKGITRDCLKQIRINIPPLPEQKKIAHILSTVQRAIEAQEQIIQTTTELFKTMLHQLMTAQISVSKENLSMDDWQTRRLGDVLQLNYGKSLSVKNRVEGHIPVYGSNGIVGSHNKAIVDAPGLIVGRKGSAGQVHRSLVPFCPIDTAFYVTAEDALDADLEFLFYLLRHIDLTRITGDVGVPGLNRDMAYMETVRYPKSFPEQKKIAKILSTIQQKVDNAESKKTKLQDLFRTLLHELMTAKIRVSTNI